MADDLPPPPPPPPAPPAPNVPKAAYVEEYNEEAQAGRPETRQSANISSKRSRPDIPHTKTARDEHSDSGYSSHTAATLGSSAPSSLESKAGSNPPKVQENTAASKRKPTGTEKTAKGGSRSPEQPPLRKPSSKAKKDAPVEATRHHESRPRKPLLGGLFQKSKSPPVVQIAKEAPKVLPVRPRPSTSQSDHRVRPNSFHVAAAPILVPQPINPYPPAPIYPTTSFPPPPQYPYYPQPQHTIPPQGFYAPPLSPYTPPPHPTSSYWSHGAQSAHRPRSVYTAPTPMVEYGDGPVYKTISPGGRSSSHKPLLRERSQVSPEDYPTHPEDYYKMPPPPPKIIKNPAPEQKPSLVRRTQTTSDAHPSSRNGRSGYEEATKKHSGNGSPNKQSFAEHESSRRPAAGSVKRSDESIPSTHGIDYSNAGKQRRRASVYGHESLRDLEGEVEAYQASHKTPAATNALPIDTLVRRRKPPGSSSETSSRHSGKSGKSRTSRASREGSEVKSRRPSSDVKSRNDNDGLSMSFDRYQKVNVQMKRGVDSISIGPSKDGDGKMELGIGPRGRTVGSRPSMSRREGSRRSYSYVDGQGVTEVERPKTSSRPPRSNTYRDERGMPLLERVRTTNSATESIEEECEPRIIRERIITRSRSRRSTGYYG